MRQLIDQLLQLDAGQVLGTAVIITILGVGSWALVRFVQFAVNLYNDLEDIRIRNRDKDNG